MQGAPKDQQLLLGFQGVPGASSTVCYPGGQTSEISANRVFSFFIFDFSDRRHHINQLSISQTSLFCFVLLLLLAFSRLGIAVVLSEVRGFPSS